MTTEVCGCNGIIDTEYLNRGVIRVKEIEYCNMHYAAPELLEALESLYKMAKHYKPLPDKYYPTDEDEEGWAIAMLYSKVDEAIAAGSRGADES